MLKSILHKIIIITTASFLFLFVAFGSAVLALGPSNNKIYEGIDVSEWQGNINFSKVKQSGIEIVYIRAGQGFNYEDSKFERNYREAKKQGLKVGAYLYVTARNEEEAREQAKFFVSLVGTKQIDCKLAMDFEYFPNLTKEEVNKISIAFLEEVEKLSGKEAIVYSDAFNARNTFSGEVTKYPLWIAEYGVKEPESNVNWKSWEGFQFTDKGRIPGITGNVDRDKFTQDILLEDNQEIPQIERPVNKKEDRIRHKVSCGDNLTKLAIKYNTTVRDIVVLNNIKNPNLIFVEDILIISYNRINETKTTYKVKYGDTLTSIAKKYETTVKHLVEINRIKNKNLIYAGETLII